MAVNAPKPVATQPDVQAPVGSELPPRVRYAKNELVRVLTALELSDHGQVELGIRTMELEERLADAQEQAARWRRNYEAMRDLFAVHGMHPELAELDRLMRIWACKA